VENTRLEDQTRRALVELFTTKLVPAKLSGSNGATIKYWPHLIQQVSQIKGEAYASAWKVRVRIL